MCTWYTSDTSLPKPSWFALQPPRLLFAANPLGLHMSLEGGCAEDLQRVRRLGPLGGFLRLSSGQYIILSGKVSYVLGA